MHSPSQGGLAARPGRSPGVYGRVGRERAGRRAGSAARVLCGAGIAGHPVCWPKAVGAGISVRGSSHSPSRGGLAARAGRTRAYAGQRGACVVWNGSAGGPRARQERSTGQQGRGPPSLSRQSGNFGTSASQRHCISAAPGGWQQGRGAPEHVRGREGMGWYMQAGRRERKSGAGDRHILCRGRG